MDLLISKIRHLVVICLDWANCFVFGPIRFNFVPSYKLALASGVFYSKKDDDEFGGEVDLNDLDEEKDDDEEINDADTQDYDPPEI